MCKNTKGFVKFFWMWLESLTLAPAHLWITLHHPFTQPRAIILLPRIVARWLSPSVISAFYLTSFSKARKGNSQLLYSTTKKPGTGFGEMAFSTLQPPDTSSRPEVPWDTEQQQAQWGFLVCLQAVRSAKGIKDFMPNPSQQRDWEEWAGKRAALAGGWWVSKAWEPKWGG